MTESDTPAPGAEQSASGSRWTRAGVVTIRCREDGPLVIEIPEGEASPGVRVIDHEGGEFVIPGGKRAVALCRCGASAKKPFCDGNHREAGFQAKNLAGS